MTKTLEELTTIGVFRRTVLGDPPPAEPPRPGYVWNNHAQWSYWEEPDDQLRARILEANKIR